MNEPKMLTMEEFKSELANLIEVKIRELGLDKVDRKHGVFPSKEDPNGDDLANLTKDERIAKFLTAVVMDDKVTAKALSEGTPADGGYLVPNEFRASVIEKLLKKAVIRPRATVIPLKRDKMDVPAEANAVSVYWTNENVALTESNPTWGNVTLNTNKLTGLSKMSRELFADSAISIVDFVSRKFADKFAAEEDAKFVAGSGTGQPKGIRTYTFAQTLAQAGANIAADDIKKLFYKLPVQYRTNAVWILHNDVIQKVALLKDTTGRYLWSTGLEGAPATILGRPVVEQNDIPVNLGAGTNESEVYFGDLSYYLIGDREEISVESTTEGAGTFENHQVALKFIERLDGQLGLTESFAQMTAVK